MRICGIIEPDEMMVSLIRGKPIISHQVKMFQRYGVEDIFIDREGFSLETKEILEGLDIGIIDIKKDMDVIRKSFDGMFFIGGNLFVEEDFLGGFSSHHSSVFMDKTTNQRLNLFFYKWGEEVSKEYDVSGKIWKKIISDLDLFYAENKLALLYARNEIEKIRLFSFDLDGTTILGKKPISGAHEFLLFLLENKKMFSFLTNNSSRTNNLHAENLKAILGIPIKEENIMSSIDSLEIYLEENQIIKVYPFVNEVVKSYLSKKISLSDTDPDLVVVGFNTDAKYNQMVKVSELIFKGIPYILIHPDLRCPTEFGYMPDAGAFGKIFELTTDKKPIWIGGKPNLIMVDGLSKKYSVEKEGIAYVGDRIYTDIEMARKAGIFGFLVLTGETSLKDYYEYVRENGESKNIFVIDNLNFLKAFLKRLYKK